MVAIRRRCLDCGEWRSPKTLRRHLKYGCPHHQKRASKLRRAADAALARLRLLGLAPPSSQSPPPYRPLPHPPPAELHDRVQPPVPPAPPFDDRRMRSPALEQPRFAFDTPGAGPGPSTQAQSPRFAPYNPDDPNQLDSDREDDEEDELDGLEWMNGLTAREYYAQDAQRELLQQGGLQLPEYDRLTVQAFNYKVDTDISGRAYSKLPRAFPDHLGDLPMDPKLQKQIDKISTYTSRSIHCCVNSCVAYTGEYARLDSCPWCGEARYKAHRKSPVRRVPRQTFRYLPLIPRLVNLYRNPTMAGHLRYRVQRQHVPGSLTDIFDGCYYRRLLQQVVHVGSTRLGHRFFSRTTDIALGLSTDGFGPFKTRKQQCWPLILINYNLPPSIRTRLEHILCLGVIPGPQSPKELDTFLEPLINELDELVHGISAFDSADQHPFLLHAYLIAGFGDMPAVAKMMNMKGHNGKLPCRACNIRGVRARTGPNPNTNYVPLSQPFNDDPNSPRRYKPLELPLRTHAEYLRQAMRVEEATNDAEEDRRSMQTGINGLSPLARVPGLEFPCSFPHDFMHLIFENIIPTLLDLWSRSGHFEGFGSEDDAYTLHEDIWTFIAAACPLAGNTIPYAFGCHVPDLKKKRAEVTAESRLLFATLLGPILLRGRFREERYYKHFIQLVHLINLCIDFEITRNSLEEIRQGFATWVQDYERYYYKNDPNRLLACTLPLHALLHIADDIENMGPVWAYWAFPMERFCGALTRACMSRRFPYSSLNRRVLQLAQLSQIKLIYGLAEELELDDCRENIRHGVHYEDHYPDLVFINPSRQINLQDSLKRKVAKYISQEFGVAERTIFNALGERRVQTWGRMQRLDKSLTGENVGGDVIRGAMLVSNSETTRDASHVRFHSRISRWRWDRVRPIEVHEEILSYGRAEMFIVIEPDLVEGLGALNPRQYVLAIISPFPQLRYHSDADLVEYQLTSGNYASAEVVDVTSIDCLIGRVEDRGSYVVERTSVVGHMDMLDIVVNPD